MKKELNPVIAIGAIVVVVLVAIGLFMVFGQTPTAPHTALVPGKLTRPPVGGRVPSGTGGN